MKRLAAMLVPLLLSGAALATPESPYRGQEQRPIKALSEEQVAGYLNGRGMGQAKTAELNGYPGPRHVLDLAIPLALTGAQRDASQALFERMQAEAITLGQRLVEQERLLDQAFDRDEIDGDSLAQRLAEIGALQAGIRRAHLAAHLEQRALLTPHQIQRYSQLRGYSAGSQTHQHPGHGDSP